MQSVTRTTSTAALDECHRELAQQVADQVFDAMRWMHVAAGIIQDVSAPAEWKHRRPEDVETDLAYLQIHRPAVLEALSAYLADASLRTRELDWLFLNVLTYAEYIATISEIRQRLLGPDKYIKSLHPPKREHFSSISDLAVRPWMISLPLVATGLSLLVHPLLALCVGLASAYWYSRKKSAVKRLDSVLSAMFRTYSSFNTVDLSWSHVARALDESRSAGVIWDASLFRLAEVRQSAA
jgi:hypothetical protein